MSISIESKSLKSVLATVQTRRVDGLLRGAFRDTENLVGMLWFRKQLGNYSTEQIGQFLDKLSGNSNPTTVDLWVAGLTKLPGFLPIPVSEYGTSTGDGALDVESMSVEDLHQLHGECMETLTTAEAELTELTWSREELESEIEVLDDEIQPLQDQVESQEALLYELAVELGERGEEFDEYSEGQ